MGFFGGYGGSCGFGGGYGYGGGYSGSNFAIIVVLFILLVIVGASCFKGNY
ncbi:sporulation protein YjcZ [Priestia aryabhattai]|uniref:sporulation protein YjcZ n=1 Tax=Priestia aryabhattai TaxID=412384 RepID=UPI003D2B9B18